jgi:hypothetical protein
MVDTQQQKMSWYGIKTLYRTTATGQPTHVDDDFDNAFELIEERVILCEAMGIDEAIQAAETLAQEYAHAVSYANIYGQTVTTSYLGACDAYAIEGALSHGSEAYSATRLVGEEVSNEDLIDQMLGPSAGWREQSPRKKFLRAAIAEALWGKARD